jgi:hypothetical protein
MFQFNSERNCVRASGRVTTVSERLVAATKQHLGMTFKRE